MSWTPREAAIFFCGPATKREGGGEGPSHRNRSLVPIHNSMILIVGPTVPNPDGGRVPERGRGGVLLGPQLPPGRILHLYLPLVRSWLYELYSWTAD